MDIDEGWSTVFMTALVPFNHAEPAWCREGVSRKRASRSILRTALPSGEMSCPPTGRWSRHCAP